MKKIIFLSFLLLTSLSFISCDKDDDDDVKSSELIGNWKITHSSGYYKDSRFPEENEEWDKDDNSGEIFTFNEDGTYGSAVENTSTKGKWKLDKNLLTLTETWNSDEGDVQTESYTVTVVELTKSKLILEYYEKDETSEMYSKDTFVKI